MGASADAGAPIAYFKSVIRSEYLLYIKLIFVIFFAGITGFAKNSEQKDANMNNKDRLKHRYKTGKAMCGMMT